MQRHHRDLLAAIAAIMLLLLGLLGWSALSHMRQAVTMVVADAASPSPAVPPALKSAPPPTSAGPSSVNEPATLRVHIVGAVRRSAVYALPSKARVDDALKLAGGATADADLERINLADFLKDGEQVRIPRKGERPPVAALAAAPRSAASPHAPPAASSAPSYRSTARYPLDERAASQPAAGGSGTAARGAAKAGSGGKVNLNTAGPAELDDLPGVGPATATAILDYRREHGRFMRIEDIMEVRGIGEKKFEKMKGRLTVD